MYKKAPLEYISGCFFVG